MAAAGLTASSAGIDAQTERNSGSANPGVSNAGLAGDLLESTRAPLPPGVVDDPGSIEPKLSTAEAAMLRSRSARTLLRNGTDFIKYQQHEKALTYLREAERRQKELNANEKSSLRQAIDLAQQGLRTPSLQTGYARTRRPQAGSIAIASRTTASSKADPAVARTEAQAEPMLRQASASAPVPAYSDYAERAETSQASPSAVDKLAPLAPEILAKQLPSAAELAQTDSARAALKEYHSAGFASNEPRTPVDTPRPLNEKIDEVAEDESQFHASESRPNHSPDSIAASFASTKSDDVPAPLPGSPSLSAPAPEPAPLPPSLEAAPLPVETTRLEESSEPVLSEPAEATAPVIEPKSGGSAPVVQTPELPALEPTDAALAISDKARKDSADDSLPTLTAPEPPVEKAPEPTTPAELPKLAPESATPAEIPPLPSTRDERPEPADLPVSRNPEPEKVDAIAPPLPVHTESADLAEAPKPEMPANRDPNLEKVQDLAAPPIELTVEEPVATKPESTRDDTTPAAAEAAPELELPPLPTGSGLRSLPDSVPAQAVQPIAEAADDSSDLPPLPSIGDAPKLAEPAPVGDGLPQLPSADLAREETPAPVEFAKPVAEESPAAPSQPESAGLPQLPAAEEAKPAEPAGVSDALPQLPDSPPAPTAPASDTLPQLPEAPVRTAQATPGGTGPSDTLPPLPAEEIAGGAAAPAAEAPRAANQPQSRRYLSGLSDRQRREIEDLARLQLERSGGTTPGLSPLTQPPREAGDETPRVPLPAGNTAMFGATEDPLVRLELPRAPSPAEARPIRAILLPEQFDTLKQREFEPRRKMWASAATAHYPLYFQDPSLERYGISVEQRLGRGGRKLTYPIDDPKESKLRNQIATPFFSSGLFALQIATWPFRAIADPPWESEYDLGYYRPGDLVPEDTVVIPWKGVGPLFRGNGY
jgi:hypothetical protein